MAGIELNLTDEKMNELLSKELLKVVDEDARGKIIAQAIEYLTTPKATSTWGQQRSPVQEAFQRAMERWTEGFARDYVANNEGFQKIIREKLGDIAELMMADNIEIKKAIQSAFAQATAGLVFKDDEE